MSLFSFHKKSGNKYTQYRQKPEKKARASRKGAEKGRSALGKWSDGVDWPIFRIRFVIGVFCLIWIALWARAWYLQMVEGSTLADRARRQHMASELVAGKRGIIYDRKGQVLARSVEAKSVYARPGEIVDVAQAANALGPILGIDRQKLHEELSRPKRRFIWLKRKVDDATAIAVRKSGLPGIGLSKEYDRFYPFKHMAGQLLGFVGLDDKGLEGLERSLDSRLGAMPVRQIVQRDAMGRRFYLHEEGKEEPAGEDLALTLDMRIQFIAEEALEHAVCEFGGRWGGALVVDVTNGDILAWAQYPFFNPNLYRESTPAVYRNRLASDALEPGSTFKPLVMAAALQEKKVTPNTLINCENGRWQTKTYTIRDTSIRDILPVSKVMRYSSNIGMAKIGLSLGARQFYKYLHSLGFGEYSTVPVANSKGILRAPREWGEMDIMATSFGQSISVTGLQMAQAYLTLLNNGVYKPLRLLKEETHVEEAPRRVFNERTAHEVMDMMRDVVEAPDGTGKRARVDGIEVGGKTGTAQKADHRSGKYGDKSLASFVGFFPAKDPNFLVLVLVDEPARNQFGGIVAAPAFREIAGRLLTCAGILDENRIVAKAGENRKERRKRGLKLASLDQPWAGNSIFITRPVPANGAGMNFPGHLAKAARNVPDVKGKSVRSAVELFARAGIVPELKGHGGKVVRQSPPAGSPWPTADKNVNYVLWLSEL